MVWDALVGLLVGLALCWVFLVALLWRSRPSAMTASEVVRLLPDALGLIGRLARDRSLPKGIRLRLWVLIAYLAMPIDFVPDFIPVIGYADDAIVIAVVLRSVVKAAGADAVRDHWRGSDAALTAVLHLTGVKRSLR